VYVSEARALTDAEALMKDGRAASVRVEPASAHPDGCWHTSPYERSGTGWTATRADGGSVKWTPFYPLALAMS
jgi:hypothetical protein